MEPIQQRRHSVTHQTNGIWTDNVRPVAGYNLETLSP